MLATPPSALKERSPWRISTLPYSVYAGAGAAMPPGYRDLQQAS
jgi:hypothetical protein